MSYSDAPPGAIWQARASSLIRRAENALWGPPGEKGAKKLAWLRDSQRLKIPALRHGDKDLTDFHKSGGNLYSLIENALHPESAPIFVTWPVDAKPATTEKQYWRNPDNRTEAFYMPDQLELCLDIMNTQRTPFES